MFFKQLLTNVRTDDGQRPIRKAHPGTLCSDELTQSCSYMIFRYCRHSKQCSFTLASNKHSKTVGYFKIPSELFSINYFYITIYIFLQIS